MKTFIRVLLTIWIFGISGIMLSETLREAYFANSLLIVLMFGIILCATFLAMSIAWGQDPVRWFIKNPPQRLSRPYAYRQRYLNDDDDDDEPKWRERERHQRSTRNQLD